MTSKRDLEHSRDMALRSAEFWQKLAETSKAPDNRVERLSKEVDDLQQELRDTRAFLFLRAKDRAYGKFSREDVKEAYERTSSRSVARSFDEHTGVTTFEFPAVRHEDPAAEKSVSAKDYERIWNSFFPSRYVGSAT